MSDITSTSTPTLAEQFVALATALLARLSAHDKALDAALAADADANTKIADLTNKLSSANDQISTLQAKVDAELDPTPLTNVIAQMQAAVNAPDPEAPEPVVVQTATGAMATVDPVAAVTTHESDDGVVTTVPHDGTEPTAVDANNQPVAVPPAAVAEAVAATVDAGVTAPAIATPVDVPAAS